MTIARHQSCAERQRKHGPLVPMERPEGEPAFAVGVILTAAFLGMIIAGVLLVAALSQGV